MRVSVDIIALSLAHTELRVLLIERKGSPFAGTWALPGGFVLEHESLEAAAARELQEETGVSGVALEQLRAFGAPDRDPRYRVITISYMALMTVEQALSASTDAARAAWFPLSELPRLAFDHTEIFEAAMDQLKLRVRSTPIIFDLLPKLFTLTQAQELLERILREPLDKRNFRKKLLSLGFLEGTKQILGGRRSRPAQLFRFNRKKFLKASSGFGFSFC
jgi:8-oxo-dGTP diphosphatase